MKNLGIIEVKPLGFTWETQDPFLFCVHHHDAYPKGNQQMEPVDSLEGRTIGNDFTKKDGWRMYHGNKIPGFPGHPHRGFETVTIVREGFIDHTDSTGGAGRFGAGDVQWMTAGKGVLHSEMFPLIHTEKPNPLELFQIWLNLPKKDKMVDPYYTMLWREMIPKVSSSDNKYTLEIISGVFNNVKGPTPPPNSWASSTTSNISILHIEMNENARFNLPASNEGINRTIYFYEGEDLSIEGTEIPSYHLVKADATKNLTLSSGTAKLKVLILEGKPIGEPVAQHGPFVMNTQKEIMEAFEEYRKTQFGGWPWPSYEFAHDRSKGRFSIDKDGVEELP
jgi:redox-sensitive bicupin YhaK (pirin superfamily)